MRLVGRVTTKVSSLLLGVEFVTSKARKHRAISAPIAGLLVRGGRVLLFLLRGG